MLLIALVGTASAFEPAFHRGVDINAQFARFAAPAIVAAVVALANPAAVLAADADVGKNVFKYNCAACHAGGRNVISTRIPSLDRSPGHPVELQAH